VSQSSHAWQGGHDAVHGNFLYSAAVRLAGARHCSTQVGTPIVSVGTSRSGDLNCDAENYGFVFTWAQPLGVYWPVLMDGHVVNILGVAAGRWVTGFRGDI